MKSVYLGSDTGALERVYSPAARRRIEQMTNCLGTVDARTSLDSPAARMAEAAFSTWGMPPLSDAEIGRFFPNLRYIFYAAGSVQYFARPFLARGVRVFSAWQANAVPVAEYAASQILLALKGYFQVQALARGDRTAAKAHFSHYPGIYGAKIGLIGCGAVGRRVAKLLQNCALEVLVCDPYLSEDAAVELSVTKTDMDSLFAQCDVVSNHLPNLPSTVHSIKRHHLFSMKPYATFINTGRGVQLDEKDLFDALSAVPTRTALLDVLTDEEHSDQSPLNALQNCFITPHIAGSAGQEVWRMAEYMADECQNVLDGKKCLYEVTPEMLETMA
ncbi:MAG: hydroxyacid dehydrogenase [Christensenellales bacterium]|jgi:phosphoglycerate dehydrogenase-like enzyme